MATTKGEEKKISSIKPATEEMEAFLRSGYPDMSVKKAETIIAEREKDPSRWPYDVYERAQAFLAAYRATPVVVSPRKGWTRKSKGR